MNNTDFSLVQIQETEDPVTIPPCPVPTTSKAPWELWISWAVFKFPSDSDVTEK
jgi:hypothetical protein